MTTQREGSRHDHKVNAVHADAARVQGLLNRMERDFAKLKQQEADVARQAEALKTGKVKRKRKRRRTEEL